MYFNPHHRKCTHFSAKNKVCLPIKSTFLIKKLYLATDMTHWTKVQRVEQKGAATTAKKALLVQ